MGNIYNIYCDESCHLENDQQEVMVLGAIWCPLDRVKDVSIRLREFKMHYNLKKNFEIKWTKVSPAKLDFYMAVMDYFFDNDDLHFRALVADKTQLHHKDFDLTHDDWYYRMYYNMLKIIFDPKSHYRIYIDIKDTQGHRKLQKLHEVLSNSMFDFSRSIIERIQQVRSYEIEIMQLTDFLIGTISYVNRGLSDSSAKLELVKRMQKRSGYTLKKTTLYREDKVNLFHWQPDFDRRGQNYV